jgi:SAM-dependent methyltransferase
MFKLLSQVFEHLSQFAPKGEKSLEQLQIIREYELGRVIPLMSPGSKILEIGAGTGWQAQALAKQGFQVAAIEIASSPYAAGRIWPAIEYDGRHIPFADHQFDIVFSSNVLEHIPHIDLFQAEMRRVLKPKGVAIHVLPSSAWRFWTIVSHYPCIPSRLKNALGPILSPSQPNSLANRIKITLYRLYKLLHPSRHGERGNVLTEIYFFSRFFWLPLFKRTGWQVRACYSNKLFYTGYSLFDQRLSLGIRKFLSYILGGACMIYVLKKDKASTRGPN